MRVLLAAGLTIIVVAVILMIIGLATPEWIVLDLDKEQTEGLFQECLPVIKCFEIEEPSDTVTAVKVFVIIGLLTGGLSGVLALVHLICVIWTKGSYRHLALIVATISIFAAVSAVIGIIIYGADFDNIRHLYHLGYSFTLCLVGAILVGSGGALFFFGDKKRSLTLP